MRRCARPKRRRQAGRGRDTETTAPATPSYTEIVVDMSTTIATMEEKSRSTYNELLEPLSLFSNYDGSVGTSDHGDESLELYVDSHHRDER